MFLLIIFLKIEENELINKWYNVMYKKRFLEVLLGKYI